MMKTITCSLILAMAVAMPAVADESLPNDQAQQLTSDELKFLVAECESCHGKDGKSTNNAIPSLAGKSADTILHAVEQFYFYERHCPNAKKEGQGPKSGARNMCDVADRLTKQEVMAIGAWFESK